MHELLEAHCNACGFSMKGLGDTSITPTCGMCGLPLATRSNLSISRQLPEGLGLLMGAFAASTDASPLLNRIEGAVPGFARRWV
ncbi:MAG: hypothetical protein WDA16_13030 [Candidatus Thermoplasmatota archaeon]